MAAVLLQLVRKVNDADSFERAFLYTYATTAAKFLADDRFATLDADGFDVTAHHWAETDAVLVAFLHLAAVSVEDSDTSHLESTVNSNG